MENTVSSFSHALQAEAQAGTMKVLKIQMRKRVLKVLKSQIIMSVLKIQKHLHQVIQ